MLGKIGKITEWRNNRGCYMEIAGKTYAHLGNPHAKVGDEISFQVGELAKDGKHNLIRILAIPLLSALGISPPPSPAPRASPIPAAANKEGQPITRLIPQGHPATRDRTITRLACLKAACSAVAGTEMPAEQIIILAKRFEKFVEES